MSGARPGGRYSLGAVLFDATGTLIELREPVGDTYARFGRAHGAAISPWRLADAFARIWQAGPPPLFPELPPEAAAGRERAAWRERVRQTFLAADSAARLDDFEACFDALWRHYAGAEAWRPREGAEEALRTLRARGAATAVVSNFDQRLPGILAALGLAPLLDRVVLPSDAGAAKPDARIFRAALDALRVAPEHAAFVGDDAERDLAGARAAGLRAVDAASLATLADLPRLLEARHAGAAPSADAPPEETR